MDEPTQKVENDRPLVYSKIPITSVSKHNKNKQTHISKRTSSVQAVPQTKLKYVQTSKEFTSSTAIQTDTQKKKEKKETSGVLLQEELHLDSDFDKFAEKLHDNEQTQKFIKCISCLSKGTLRFTNMAWKSFLEMGSLLSCTSTMTMEYDKEWLEFCQVIYHMFGVGVINALRGRGHFSQVASKGTVKGKYNPVKGEFNFPIPSIPTLKN